MTHQTKIPAAPMNDTSIMPFGIHKGKALANVPAKYLLWLHDKVCEHEGVRRYIIENLSILKKEAGRTTR